MSFCCEGQELDGVLKISGATSWLSKLSQNLFEYREVERRQVISKADKQHVFQHQKCTVSNLKVY